MKRIAIIAITVIVLVAMITSVTTVLAAKGGNKGPKAGRQGNSNSVLLPNGFPSGPHHNLIFHGKNESFECISPSPGGGSVFIPLWTTDLNGELVDGDVTIRYIQNKSKGATELNVLDSCAIDDGLAIIELPSKVLLDDGVTKLDTNGYWVFAKITGTPGKVDANSLILYPNRITKACNDPGEALNPEFPDYTSCDEGLALGMIYGDDIWVNDPNVENPQEFVRFEPPPPPPEKRGKGKSVAANITRLFEYTGWVVDESLDTYTDDGAGTCTLGADEAISLCDVPVDDYDLDTVFDRDYNDDGVENDDDVEAWLTDQSLLATPMAWYFENVFMHEIADLVVTEQGLENEGARTLQVRFYPRSTTVFK